MTSESEFRDHTSSEDGFTLGGEYIVKYTDLVS